MGGGGSLSKGAVSIKSFRGQGLGELRQGIIVCHSRSSLRVRPLSAGAVNVRSTPSE